MRNATFVVLAAVLVGTEAHARHFSPRTANFLSADRAGMIDGPNQYAYARSNPVMNTDPTGMFADIDPEMPFLGRVHQASIMILLDLALSRLREVPCDIPSWPTVVSALRRAALEKAISIRYTPSVWQERAPTGVIEWKALPAWTEIDGRTITLSPGAAHTSIVSASSIEWAAPQVPVNGKMGTIQSWIGLLGHELTHVAGYYGSGWETLANQVGVFLERRRSNDAYLLLSAQPYTAGPPP